MTPQKAYSHGIRADDANITEARRRVISTWEVWVANDLRPNGKQILTSGNVDYCCQWVGQLRRLDV